MSYVEKRLAEIGDKRKKRVRHGRPAAPVYRRLRPKVAPKPKPMPANAKQLLHIAECLRATGMVNFADVIERAAKKLPK